MPGQTVPSATLAMEDVNELLGCFQGLTDLPRLPARKERLWSEAKNEAAAGLKKKLQERAALRTAPPGGQRRPGKHHQERRRRQIESRIMEMADRTYRQKDKCYARAAEARKEVIEEKCKELELRLSPVRNDLLKRTHVPDPWAYRQIWCSPAYINCVDMVDSLTAKALEPFIFDLERIKVHLQREEAEKHQQQRPGAEQAEGRAAEARRRADGDGERDRATDHGRREVKAPARLWSKGYCPSCGRWPIDWVSAREFSRRCKEAPKAKSIKPDTVRKYLHDGTFCGNRLWQVPWCARCKRDGPMGNGKAAPSEEASDSDYYPDDNEKKQMQAWATAAMQKQFRNYDRDALPGKATPRQQRARLLAENCYQGAFTVIAEACQEAGRLVSKDKALQVAEQEIVRLIRADKKSLAQSCSNEKLDSLNGHRAKM